MLGVSHLLRAVLSILQEQLRLQRYVVPKAVVLRFPYVGECGIEIIDAFSDPVVFVVGLLTVHSQSARLTAGWLMARSCRCRHPPNVLADSPLFLLHRYQQKLRNYWSDLRR